MTITYSLAPIPKWVIMNNQGEAAGGAKLYTYRSLNKVQQKAVYQDPAGTIPYTNPILFDANGTEGPFYWSVDDSNLDDTYYLEAYDSDDNLLWTIDDYFPPGSGGGGSTTTYVPLNNLIANNVFIEHRTNTGNPTDSTNLVIAPGNHHGFTPDIVPVVGTWGVVGPDTRFVKNNTNATDQITFVPFTLGLDPLTGDVTPIEYLRYQCTNSPAGETYKAFQFPICQKVGNLDNQIMTFTLWARVGVTPINIALYLRQYFGSGGSPSPEVRALISTIALTTGWQKFTLEFTVDSVAGKTLGDCGDDAIYLQLDMPLGVPCDVWFTKPSLYVGAIDPSLDFETYDQIDAVTNSPRSGDVRTSLNKFQPFGWVSANDGTIGNESSGGTTRAKQDTFFLYKNIWDQMSGNQAYAPMYTSGGVPTAYGASAVADFSADNQISLTKALGKVFTGTASEFYAAQDYTADPGTDLLTVGDAVRYGTATPVILFNSGGVPPDGLSVGAAYYTIFVSNTTLRLASTIEDALAGSFVNFTTAGTGTNSIQEQVVDPGVFLGEEVHVLIESELPNPITTTATAANISNAGSGLEVLIDSAAGGGGTVVNTGGNNPHNTMQPSTYMNIFFKL